MDKYELFNEIRSWYDYDMKITNNNIIVSKGNKRLRYKTIEEALVDWLSTLELSNKAHENEGLGKYYLWEKEIIDFIRQLKAD